MTDQVVDTETKGSTYSYTPMPFRTVLVIAGTVVFIVVLIANALIHESDNSVKKERSKYEQCAKAVNIGDCLYRAQGYND